MGQRGPIPKRSEARRRRNVESKTEQVAPVVAKVRVPAADRKWHRLARAWYESLAESGQSRFFEPSDWAAARYVAEVMSRSLAGEEISATLFRAVWSSLGDLMTTEAARRRLRLEVDRQLATPPAQSAAVTALADYRKTLGA